MKFFYILGGPGSGKGSLCSQLPQFRHLSVGDLQREEAKRDTELGRQLRASLAAGQLTPDATTVSLLVSALDERPVLLDGFPRTEAQMRLFEAEVGHGPELAIYLLCSDATMRQRIAKRNERRADDIDSAAVERRLQISRDVSIKVIEFIRPEKFFFIDAEQSKEQVLAAVNDVLNKI
jgi:adenylate kinase